MAREALEDLIRATHEIVLPEFLYHGTSTLYLENMLSEGLKPCSMTGKHLMTCLADDIEIARHHALHMAEWEQRDPIVFRIPIGRFDIDQFTLEDKFVEIGPSVGRGSELEHRFHEHWESAPWTWRSMLGLAGAVGYRGIIQVTSDDLVKIPDAEVCPGFR